MLDNKLPVLCVVLISFALFVNGAPYGSLTPSQNAEVQRLVTRIITLKFAGEDVSKLSVEQAMQPVLTAFNKEIALLEKETHVRLDSLDMTETNDLVTRQLRLAGVSGAAETLVRKVVQVLALKFHDRNASNQPTPQEMFEELRNVLDKEIKVLEDQKNSPQL